MAEYETLAATDFLAGTVVAKKLFDAISYKSITDKLVYEKNTELVNSGGTSLVIRKRVRGTAQYVDWGTSLTASDLDTTTVTVNVTKKLGAAYAVPGYVNALSDVDLLKVALENIRDEIAMKEDELTIKEIIGYTTVTDEAVGTGDGTQTTFELDHSPVLQIIDAKINGTPTTDYTYDPIDGKIKFGSAPAAGASITASYAYADGLNATAVGTFGDLGVSDVFKAISDIRSRYIEPTALVLSRRAEWLLSDELMSKFVFTEDTKKINGFVGVVNGLEVYVEPHLPDGVVLVMDTKTAAIKAYANPNKTTAINVEKKVEPAEDKTYIYGWTYFAPVLVNVDSVQLILGFDLKCEDL